MRTIKKAVSLELETFSPDTISPGCKYRLSGVGGGSSGGNETTTDTSNQYVDFSTDDQENEEPSPMNWENLNRILREIEYLMPLSPSSHQSQNVASDRNYKKKSSSSLPTKYGATTTPSGPVIMNQYLQVQQMEFENKEMNGIIKESSSVAKAAVGNLPETQGGEDEEMTVKTLNMMQYDNPPTSPRPTTPNQNRKVLRTKLKQDELQGNIITDGSGMTNHAAVDFPTATELDEEKEKAVNALIKRMFDELAAEMIDEKTRLEQDRRKDENMRGVAERNEVKIATCDGDEDIIEARDPEESICGEFGPARSTSNEDGVEEIEINHTRDDDIPNLGKEIPEIKRTDDEEERTRHAQEKAVVAAVAELERGRRAEDEIQRQQAEATKRKLAEEQKRKEQIELVTTVLHASCGNEINAYYKVLGVSPTCSISDIKKAYRKLALKLHPDKEKYNTPKADEAFKAASHAYDVLKDETLRNEYDRSQYRSVSNHAATASTPTNNEPTIPIIISNGTRITIQSHDIRFAHFNGLQGCVVSYDSDTDLYTIQIDDHCTTMKSKITALFRNVIVCLRAAKANELGVFLVTLVSYYKDDRGGLYQARYNDGGGKRGSVYLRSEQFIIPNGTVVGLHCGNYGTIVDWRETLDQYTRADVSYYKVQLYNDIFIRVPMRNVRL